MDLWQGKLVDFVESARSGALAGTMSGQYATIHGSQPSPGEFRSWQRSLGALGEVLKGSRLADVGVAVGSKAAAHRARGSAAAENRQDVGIATEYHLPLKAKRVDVMLFGQDAARAPQSIVLELKQWSEVRLEDEHAVNVLVHGKEVAHPSQQALDYAAYLTDYHEAFAAGATAAAPVAWCHDMAESAAGPLRDERFGELLGASPLFTGDQTAEFTDWIAERVAYGGGLDLMRSVTGGHFKPSKQVIDCLAAVIRHEEEWHLLDAQRVAHGAILAEVKRLQRKAGRTVVLVRGGPGTGKTVIAVQLLADALRLGLKAAHSTGGKAFTTTLRSTFKGAGDLFLWNMNLKKAPTQGLDLLLVDEAHRIRETSDTRWTKKIERTGKPQIEELVDAAKVTVILLDENQFMRPDEIGTTRLVKSSAQRLEIPLKVYDLQAQFRCGGCEEYVAWVDHLLGFRETPLGAWGDAYAVKVAATPSELDAMMDEALARGESARLIAGFGWKWSNPNPDGSLAEDVELTDWKRPWNAKRDPKKSYRPDKDPYTLWARTDAGIGQVGCIYSAQGFEFDRVGVIWGEDLVWRDDRWVAQKDSSFDSPVRRSPKMLDLVRNAYRVLLTRGMRGTSIYCVDDETREHIEESLRALE